MYVVCPHCISFVEADIEVAKVAAKANDLYLLVLRRRALFILPTDMCTGASIRQAQRSALKTSGSRIKDHDFGLKDQDFRLKDQGSRVITMSRGITLHHLIPISQFSVGKTTYTSRIVHPAPRILNLAPRTYP